MNLYLQIFIASFLQIAWHIALDSFQMIHASELSHDYDAPMPLQPLQIRTWPNKTYSYISDPSLWIHML